MNLYNCVSRHMWILQKLQILSQDPQERWDFIHMVTAHESNTWGYR